jgi:MurNAc alpha-1-phosphate uridylyltransferase
MKIAMILAAGRGTRLKPLTDKVPKAMSKIHNKPLIEYHVEKFVQLGFERIVINHAYLGGQIRQYLGNGSKWGIEICYSAEPPGGLETGGGIHAALPLLGANPFVTVNADIFTDYDFTTLSLGRESMIHMVLVPNPQHNHGDFGLSDQHQLTNQKLHTFAGIACYRPEVFQQCEAGRYSVVPLIRNLCTKNLVKGELYQGLWVDIGSFEHLKLANTIVGVRTPS